MQHFEREKLVQIWLSVPLSLFENLHFFSETKGYKRAGEFHHVRILKKWLAGTSLKILRNFCQDTSERFRESSKRNLLWENFEKSKTNRSVFTHLKWRKTWSNFAWIWLRIRVQKLYEWRQKWQDATFELDLHSKQRWKSVANAKCKFLIFLTAIFLPVDIFKK